MAMTINIKMVKNVPFVKIGIILQTKVLHPKHLILAYGLLRIHNKNACVVKQNCRCLLLTVVSSMNVNFNIKQLEGEIM